MQISIQKPSDFTQTGSTYPPVSTRYFCKSLPGLLENLLKLFSGYDRVPVGSVPVRQTPRKWWRQTFVWYLSKPTVVSEYLSRTRVFSPPPFFAFATHWAGLRLCLCKCTFCQIVAPNRFFLAVQTICLWINRLYLCFLHLKIINNVYWFHWI